MIEANELRKGNLVFGVSNRIEVVIAINENSITAKSEFLEDSFTSDCKYFSGIPITQDILFKTVSDMADKKESVYKNYQFGYSRKQKEHNFWLIYHDNKISKNISYVHELQNLIYGFTGTELTINL